jgi:uncharacterized RDD family membrane protein YckC
MPFVKLDTGFNIEVEFAIAPFAKRLLAWTIDVGICWLLTKLMATLLKTDSTFVWSGSWDIRGVLASLPVLFYFLICEITMNGRSPGKLAMNLKVITEDGGQPGIGQYLIRWVFRLVDLPYWIPVACVNNVIPWWTFPLIFTGVASIVFTERSQRTGDIVAGTLLIDLKKTASWEDTVFAELSDSYKPKYPQVMQLSDRDINTLKNIINTSKRRKDQALATRIALRIQSRVKIDTTQEPLDFLETLLLDYNYYASQ